MDKPGLSQVNAAFVGVEEEGKWKKVVPKREKEEEKLLRGRLRSKGSREGNMDELGRVLARYLALPCLLALPAMNLSLGQEVSTELLINLGGTI